MLRIMSQMVFLTCDPAMGRPRDRSILRDNQAWADQVVDYYRSHPHPTGTRFFHQTAEPMGRGEAGVRAGMIAAFGAAATAAGREGTIMLLVGHGSEQMVDLAPAPALRVTEDAVRAAHRYIGNRRAAPELGLAVDHCVVDGLRLAASGWSSSTRATSSGVVAISTTRMRPLQPSSGQTETSTATTRRRSHGHGWREGGGGSSVGSPGASLRPLRRLPLFQPCVRRAGGDGRGR